MDALTTVLHALRLKSSLYCRSELARPWGLRFVQHATAVFHTVEEEGCVLLIDGEQAPRALAPGDIVLLPYGTAHIVADAPDSPCYPDILMNPAAHLACQLWMTHNGKPHTRLLCGTFHVEHAEAHPLLSLLPTVIHIRSSGGSAPYGMDATLSQMADEALAGRPGSDLLIRRLGDVLFIQILRYWIETDSGHVKGWLAALRDPQLSRALELIHRQPDHAWSVASLADRVAMSRSAFATRFTDLVGEPPIQYLTRWRMRLAADLLRSGAPVARASLQVGYESEIAFRKAFKRTIGLPPGSYQRQQRP